MKECKILKIYNEVQAENEFAKIKYKRGEYEVETRVFDFPELEAKLNEYLNDGWKIKFAISHNILYLERELDK